MKRYDHEPCGGYNEDCSSKMVEDKQGDWVDYDEAAEAIKQAHRQGWEQCKQQMIQEWEMPWGLAGGKRFEDRLRNMKYKEEQGEQKAI